MINAYNTMKNLKTKWKLLLLYDPNYIFKYSMLRKRLERSIWKHLHWLYLGNFKIFPLNFSWFYKFSVITSHCFYMLAKETKQILYIYIKFVCITIYVQRCIYFISYMYMFKNWLNPLTNYIINLFLSRIFLLIPNENT